MKDIQVLKAIKIARQAHKGQLDKAGKDYIGHPLRVMDKMNTEDGKIAAVLHDVLEDTELTAKDLSNNGIDEYVIKSIETLSRKENESYMEYIRRVEKDHLATKVKLADLEDNMDLSRLDNITDIDLNRNKKYKKAYGYLEEKL